MAQRLSQLCRTAAPASTDHCCQRRDLGHPRQPRVPHFLPLHAPRPPRRPASCAGCVSRSMLAPAPSVERSPDESALWYCASSTVYTTLTLTRPATSSGTTRLSSGLVLVNRPLLPPGPGGVGADWREGGTGLAAGVRPRGPVPARASVAGVARLWAPARRPARASAPPARWPAAPTQAPAPRIRRARAPVERSHTITGGAHRARRPGRRARAAGAPAPSAPLLHAKVMIV